ncbi:DUF3000 domain-containing protein [Isoptericola sp. b441]|uniref:DUF3000 domain-containing protein n=1 Tax=Actinotalea lenta TaxID=3064654 RepID=A0ABT9DAG2_9CELL|nr:MULTISPECIES: DUF3000 domain-containing protein [unclassified Isoptericola]MDO8107900.1 DUF3000 domain-containing protein [Isoptericola sp. b441]MDO8120432.1 DUF3000 domain-containing protein [Isoptericola sp. b490]
MTAEGTPSPFVQALHGLHDRRLRAEVRLSEVPAPSRIAPYAVALSAEVDPNGDGEDVGSGRFVLLHDPAGQETWDGTFRVVTLSRATLDPELSGDPLLCDVAWSWVVDALTGVPHRELGGTVTQIVSQSFGTLSERPDAVEVEIRASWSPEGDAGEHLQAWADLLCTAAGLPPLPSGVTALGRPR